MANGWNSMWRFWSVTRGCLLAGMQSTEIEDRLCVGWANHAWLFGLTFHMLSVENITTDKLVVVSFCSFWVQPPLQTTREKDVVCQTESWRNVKVCVSTNRTSRLGPEEEAGCLMKRGFGADTLLLRSVRLPGAWAAGLALAKNYFKRTHWSASRVCSGSHQLWSVSLSRRIHPKQLAMNQSCLWNNS